MKKLLACQEGTSEDQKDVGQNGTQQLRSVSISADKKTVEETDRSLDNTELACTNDESRGARKQIRGPLTLEEGGNADNDFNRIAKGGIEEAGEGLAEL